MVKYKGSYNGSYNGSYKYFKCRVQGCKTRVLGISVKSLRICGVLHFRLKQPLIESFTYHYKQVTLYVIEVPQPPKKLNFGFPSMYSPLPPQSNVGGGAMGASAEE